MAISRGTEIYRDIKLRTGGDIYVGVVGPVRTGKSTFIKRFMELTVLERIETNSRGSALSTSFPKAEAGKPL